MPTTDLGACEWFAWDLRRSNLIARDRPSVLQLSLNVNGFPGLYS